MLFSYVLIFFGASTHSKWVSRLDLFPNSYRDGGVLANAWRAVVWVGSFEFGVLELTLSGWFRRSGLQSLQAYFSIKLFMPANWPDKFSVASLMSRVRTAGARGIRCCSGTTAVTLN